MTHFSIKVSERLLELGISAETEKVWWYTESMATDAKYFPEQDWDAREWTLQPREKLSASEEFQVRSRPAYNLADIPALIPQLNKAFKYDQPIWDCHKKYPGAKCENREFCEYGGWVDLRWKIKTMMEIFVDDGYPKAEQYLLTILKQ